MRPWVIVAVLCTVMLGCSVAFAQDSRFTPLSVAVGGTTVCELPTLSPGIGQALCPVPSAWPDSEVRQLWRCFDKSLNAPSLNDALSWLSHGCTRTWDMTREQFSAAVDWHHTFGDGAQNLAVFWFSIGGTGVPDGPPDPDPDPDPDPSPATESAVVDVRIELEQANQRLDFVLGGVMFAVLIAGFMAGRSFV